jgi:hypothetical protein
MRLNGGSGTQAVKHPRGVSASGGGRERGHRSSPPLLARASSTHSRSAALLGADRGAPALQFLVPHPLRRGPCHAGARAPRARRRLEEHSPTVCRVTPCFCAAAGPAEFGCGAWGRPTSVRPGAGAIGAGRSCRCAAGPAGMEQNRFPRPPPPRVLSFFCFLPPLRAPRPALHAPAVVDLVLVGEAAVRAGGGELVDLGDGREGRDLLLVGGGGGVLAERGPHRLLHVLHERLELGALALRGCVDGGHPAGRRRGEARGESALRGERQNKFVWGRKEVERGRRARDEIGAARPAGHVRTWPPLGGAGLPLTLPVREKAETKEELMRKRKADFRQISCLSPTQNEGEPAPRPASRCHYRTGARALARARPPRELPFLSPFWLYRESHDFPLPVPRAPTSRAQIYKDFLTGEEYFSDAKAVEEVSAPAPGRSRRAARRTLSPPHFSPFPHPTPSLYPLRASTCDGAAPLARSARLWGR